MRATPLETLHTSASHNLSNRPGGTRTPNPRFWRPVLYQLSYGPLTSSGLFYPSLLCSPFSGQGRNRTTDTTIFSRVLYQLSYLARYPVRYCTRHSARYLARIKVQPPQNKSTATPEKKSARPFGGGRLGEGCALRAF